MRLWESWRYAPRWAAARQRLRISRRLTFRPSPIKHTPASNWRWRLRPSRPGQQTLSGAQDKQRTNDGLATAAAVVIFWPAAFFVGGDKQTAAELAQMKGQMVAVEQASNAKKCGIQFQGPRPPGT